MADVNATFNYDADFGSALSQIKALSKELSVLNNSFNSLDKNARVLRNDLANTFTSAAGQIGGFGAKTVTITSDLDNFGKALDKSKLKLRDYYREATRAFSANSNARKLAEDQVRRTKSQLVELGMDAEGRRKGILVTPMRLDMTDMNNQLQVARKQFDIFNRLIQDGATQLINWGKNTQWAGRQLTVGLTVPMTIFASTTIKAFNDVDKELTRFQKVYGADLVGTTKEASMEMRNAIQAVAIDIAKSYGIAAKETAGLAADLAATGLEGKKLVDSVKQTSRLAVLGELDRQDAMATTLSLQNAFNMSTKQLAESIDFLNAVENQTSVSLQDLTTAIPKVGPVMQSLGGDVKDLAVLLVAMKEGGINAAESANALKSGLASLINPTKSASAIAKQYGIDLQGIVTRNKGQLMPTLLEFQASLQTLDDFGKAKIIEQLFGKYQFARISALFDNLNAQGSQTVEVMKLMGASSAELAKIADTEIKTLTESTSMRFQRAMEGIKASLLPVGETITRAVIPFMEKFAEIMGKIVEFGKNLPEPVKNFLKFTAGITAVAGPLVMITGVLANFLGYVTKGAMGFVNLGRRIAGLPTKQFSLFDDEQIAAAKATDTLTVSIQNQATAMNRLVQLMRDYNSTLVAQRAATPGAFSQTPLIANPNRSRKGPTIRRQKGSWVPGSGSGDKVKALLEPGEFVVNRNAAKQYGGVLEDINNGTPRFQSGGKILKFATRENPGGMVPTSPYEQVDGPGPFSNESTSSAGSNVAREVTEKNKLWNPNFIYGLSKGENEFINDFHFGKELSGKLTPKKKAHLAFRDRVLAEIASMDIDPRQRDFVLKSLNSGINPVDLRSQLILSQALENLIESPEYKAIKSKSMRARIAAAMILPRLRTSDVQSFKEVDPSLTTKFGDRSQPWNDKGVAARSKSYRAAFDKFDIETGLPVGAESEAKKLGLSKQLMNLYFGSEDPSVKGTKHSAHGARFVPRFGRIAIRRQNGGPIRAIRGIKMPDAYATKLSTVRQSMSNANAEAMASKLPLADLGNRQSRIGGFSSAIPGVNGVYEIGGKRYVVKGHDTEESALAEANMARITRDVFGLKTPDQEVVRVKHPETGELLFAVRSPYDEAFAKTTGRFTEDSAFDQLVASVVRRDKDLQADNLFDDIVSDVGQAGIMSKASQPRTKTGPTNSALEQLAINLGMTKGGARSHGAEAWNAATTSMTDDQIIARIKDAAAKARAKLDSTDIPDDFKYIAQDLDDIIAADLGPFVAHLRTVFPKEKKPPTEAAIAKKAQQKELDRAERESALAAGYPEWALQEGGSPFVPGSGEGDRIPALLEPGEFVVNKKAAKKYGGLLNDINFNKAPRFMAGRSVRKKNKGKSSFDLAKTPSAPSQQVEVENEVIPMSTSDDMRQSSGFSKNQRISAGTGAVGMMAMMLPQLVPANEALGKFATNVSTAMFTISALTGVMDMFGKKAKLGADGLNFMQRNAAKGAAGKAQMAAGKATGGLRGAGGMLGGAGKMAAGFLLGNPIGLAIVAGLAVAAGAWIKYRQEVNEAKKATQEAFSVGEKTAQAYGYELTSLSEKVKENAQLTKDLGIGFSQTVSAIVPEEKLNAIKDDNANFIKDLKENEGALSGMFGKIKPTNQQFIDSNTNQVKGQLLTKYATLRQQGVSAQDADEIITTIARETGDETLSILSNLRPQLEKMNGDNINEVFKASQDAQLAALKAQATSGSAGASAAFKEAMKGSIAVIQYAPPEDQLSALNNLINNMKEFSADQIVKGAEALKEAAAATYGTSSTIGSTLEQLFSTTNKNGNFKTDEQKAADLELGTKLMTAEQQGIVSTSQIATIQVLIDEGKMAEANAILDEVSKNRNAIISIDIKNKEQAEAAIAEIDKQIAAQQAKFDSEMVSIDNSIEAENERYKNAQKAHEAFIKQKQKEIEAINKSADAYIKALQDEQRADEFAQQQRDTAVGGLKALAGGDVFGFVQSQQELAGAAQQFGFESEIKAIDERRQAAVDAKQEQIKKEQELAALEDENHEKKLKAIEAQRALLVSANATEMKSLQDQQNAWTTLSGYAGGAFDKMMGGYSKAASEAGKVVAVQIAIAELAKGKTIEEAIAAGQAYMKQTYGVQNSAGGEGSSAYTTTGTTQGSSGNKMGSGSAKYASGGYISGAGGPKADLIPARLSNGEYVVQASAVDQYGVGMMEAINEQKFAGGGLVLDPSTKSKINIAEKEWGENFNIVKGGYLKSDKYSGSTHTGGGVFDAYYAGGSKLFPVEAVKALRKAGFAAWNRWQFGANNKHIHAIEIGNPKLSKSAAAQVRAYQRGEDGLGGKDTLSNDYKVDTSSVANIPNEVAPNLDRIATAMGTTVDTYNKVMNEGVAPLIGRKFGGSMTMNKPYLVGENGPEVVMPYGSGGRVVPIKYNVPAMASGGIINGSMASSSPQINVTVNGVNDPKQAADRAAQLINSEMNRRKFSRSIG
jgi:TP901 family phage tail tape measure protein